MNAAVRVALEPVWVLHRRPYRDTSELVDLFTRHHGRVAAIARGSRSGRRRVPLEPFQPLHASWSGRGELVTLGAVESRGPGLQAAGRRLLSMFYVNELLLRLTARQDPQPEMFSLYEDTIHSLAGDRQEATVLRVFERDLLELLGYGLVLDRDADGSAVEPAIRYVYRLEEGPRPASRQSPGTLSISGATLAAIRTGRFETADCLHEARVLLTAAIDHQLGGRPLKTRLVLGALRRRAT